MSRMYRSDQEENLLGTLLKKRENDIRNAFELFDQDGSGKVRIRDLENALKGLGMDPNKKELRDLIEELDKSETGELDYRTFHEMMKDENLIQRAFSGKLAIPNFKEFCEDIVAIFDETKGIQEGTVPTYIPELRNVDPDLYAVAICTIDGQRFSHGDAQEEFCLQGCALPLTYCLACEENSVEEVHKYVGREPSGAKYNAFTLNYQNKPHNPMVNTGAFVVCSLLREDFNAANRFAYILDEFSDLTGGPRVTFCQPMYLSEKDSADINFALGYYMRGADCFPKPERLTEILDLYFQVCAIESTADSVAVMAATLANGGVNPITGKECFSRKVVKNCLSLMYSCGMNDFSGAWAFHIGLPAKSGVTGATLVVVPNVLGLCIFSPRIDLRGNSVRGIEFCSRLTKRFNLSIFDLMVMGFNTKPDPTQAN